MPIKPLGSPCGDRFREILSSAGTFRGITSYEDTFIERAYRSKRKHEIELILFQNVKSLPTCINTEIAEYALGYILDCCNPECEGEIYFDEYEWTLPVLTLCRRGYCGILEGWYCDSCYPDVKSLTSCSCCNWLAHPKTRMNIIDILLKRKDVKQCSREQCVEVICAISETYCRYCSVIDLSFELMEIEWTESDSDDMPQGFLTVD